MSNILEKLKIEEPVLNIYKYGSSVYGTNTETSDEDYVIVTRSAFLKSGAFKQNAISSEDRTIQGILFSRTGFIDAINTYNMTALECISLKDEDVIQKNMNFKLAKFDNKDFVKSIINKISQSWYSALRFEDNDDIEFAKKGVYHSLRILDFALQFKENMIITDFSRAKIYRDKIFNDSDFIVKKYLVERDNLVNQLK